jgi:putative ABC transport system permease protein
VLSALPGAILGIPLGIGLFKAAVRSGILPPPLLLAAAAAAAATVLAAAALTAVPAWLGTRQPVAMVLQSEAA